MEQGWRLIRQIPPCPPGTVCWIEVKVAVLCAHQYMTWNLLLIKVFDISNTRSRLGFAQKHIWNISEEIVLLNCFFFALFKDKFSIVFQPSQGLVFQISKMIQNYDQK